MRARARPLQEVVFLDADNFVLTDPRELFEGPEYAATGALFWADFWAPDYAPEASVRHARTMCGKQVHARGVQGSLRMRTCSGGHCPPRSRRTQVLTVLDIPPPLLNVPATSSLHMTHDSGLLVVDKARHFRGLALNV